MEGELPKRIFGENMEPEVEQVNKSCRHSILALLKTHMESEYEEVRRDPVFRHIMALSENNLGYSARLVHSLMCRQLDTSKKHEMWFVFAKRPLRFSMQEFHAVTGLKYEKGDDSDFGNYVDDNGFWSSLLEKDRVSISIKNIRSRHIFQCDQWTREDRLRLVYVCVIGGVILAMDEKTAIPRKYIELVMNLDKLRSYHWGLDSYDHLLREMKAAKPKLSRPLNYPLHGFIYAFQIWIMEAIPDFGRMMGQKIIENRIVFPRCSNWKGFCALKYHEIRALENNFAEEAVWHPFISWKGNNDIVSAEEYMRKGERRDERIERIYQLLRTEKVWSNHVWQVIVGRQTRVLHDEIDDETVSEGDDVLTPKPAVSSVSTSRKGKNKVRDYGVEERKHKVLCERSGGKEATMNDEMKSFFKDLIDTSFRSMEEKIGKIETEVASRLSVVDTELRDLRDAVTTSKLAGSRGQPSTTTKASGTSSGAAIALTKGANATTKAPGTTTKAASTTTKAATASARRQSLRKTKKVTENNNL